MADYNKFVFDEIRRIGKAWVDKNGDGSGVYDIEQLFEKIGEMSWRRLVDSKTVKQILNEIGVNPADYGEDISVIENPNFKPLNQHPRVGMTIAGILTGVNHDIDETLKRFIDCGVQYSSINLINASRSGNGVFPFKKLPDGKWDLFDWDNRYFERLLEIKEKFNKAGIVIPWCFLELYSWSDRKPGPQQISTFWRNNVNGIYWPPGDSTLTSILPDKWCKEFIKKICPLLDLHVNMFRIGNELPEKGLHERIRDLVRAEVPGALIDVNRNEDTPGQYKNMKIGQNYDFISFHGAKLKQLSDLNRKDYEDGPHDSWQDFIDDGPHDKWRITFSSDGARTDTRDKDGKLLTSKDSADNPYDWTKLKEFFRHMKKLGYGIEHQSRAKMTQSPNHHMIEVDWFNEVIK